jgi:hypothetical protein
MIYWMFPTGKCSYERIKPIRIMLLMLQMISLYIMFITACTLMTSFVLLFICVTYPWLQVLANFYDRCPCCQGCLKHCVKSRSGNAGHVTQVTFADDRRSPSIHSHSSVSPKRNGRYTVNGYKENIDLQELGNSRNSSFNSLSKQNGGSPGKKVAYAPVPTQPTEAYTPP